MLCSAPLELSSGLMAEGVSTNNQRGRRSEPCRLKIWLRITDEGSISEMCIWSNLLVKSDQEWCTC